MSCRRLASVWSWAYSFSPQRYSRSVFERIPRGRPSGVIDGLPTLSVRSVTSSTLSSRGLSSKPERSPPAWKTTGELPDGPPQSSQSEIVSDDHLRQIECLETDSPKHTPVTVLWNVPASIPADLARISGRGGPSGHSQSGSTDQIQFIRRKATNAGPNRYSAPEGDLTCRARAAPTRTSACGTIAKNLSTLLNTGMTTSSRRLPWRHSSSMVATPRSKKSVRNSNWRPK